MPPNTSDSAPSPRPPPLIDDDTASRMARWVKEVVVCNFDLERGPVVERRAGGRRWGPGVKENVAFSSFPDTSLFTEGSIQFSFKIRHVPPNPAELAFPEPPSPRPGADLPPSRRVRSRDSVSEGGGLHIPEPTDRAEEYRKWDERGREWMYGFVWFQQRRDRGIARGYMQKSVVILTHLPFPALWSAVLSHLAPAFFAHGYSALEVACHAIANWPDPTPDATLDLPFFSEMLPVKLPDDTDNPQVGWGPEPILAAHPPSSPLRAFASFLPSLWSIWECLVLAEPLLIIAPDPRTCSEIVWWLRELLRPIPLAGDFRPYLHIHDHDFALLVNSNKPQAGVVVGVTNPFFRNAASHWPNVIAVPNKGAPRPARAMPDHPDGFISKRQRSVQKERALLKQLEALVAAGKLDDKAGNVALRTHFQQLTERFLVPLNRYFQTLVPPPTSGASTPLRPSLSRASSFTGPSTLPVPPPPPALSLSGLRPFSLPNFLAHLKKHGPNPLAFKSKGLAGKARVEHDFYAAFCRGACFAGWLAARVDSLGVAVANSLGVPPARLSGDSGMLSSSSEAQRSLSASQSTSERSSAEGPAETPRARGPPLLPEAEADRRLRRLEI
ncbi:uncharacterized protein COLE_05963 [Cutaneotrichosporon oleaginosum]|uniref:uncharacterized protein n=1 Tax=Cutaneotrichosporon oleaginosum TaxID=879819 RepID=UPI00132A1594|nr:hypothetical protein COLE_05963 [Cutaneotrichosporon oleaginosum]